MNNTRTKQVSIMKQTAFWREKKNGEYRACLNIQYLYLVNKYIKCNVWRLAVRYDPYMGRPIYGSLGVKRLRKLRIWILYCDNVECRNPTVYNVEFMVLNYIVGSRSVNCQGWVVWVIEGKGICLWEEQMYCVRGLSSKCPAILNISRTGRVALM